MRNTGPEGVADVSTDVPTEQTLRKMISILIYLNDDDHHDDADDYDDDDDDNGDDDDDDDNEN